MFQVDGVRGSVVGELVPLEIVPHLLDRIEIRRVSRQILYVEPRKRLLQVIHLAAAVHVAAVHDDDDLATQMLEEFAEEPDDSRRLEEIVEERAEVKAEMLPERRERQSRNQRDFVTLFGFDLQNRRFALGRQGAANEWREQQAALVEENQMGP